MSIPNESRTRSALECVLRRLVALTPEPLDTCYRARYLHSFKPSRRGRRFPQVTEGETPPNPIESNQHLVAELERFATFEDLRASAFFRTHAEDLRRLLHEPRIYRAPNPEPRLQAFLRVVEWNIERGSRLEGIVDVLKRHDVLAYADVLLINEIDAGMARSRNLNVAFELSKALSAHAIFGIEYLELTKGTGDERSRGGQNTAALHGNAILTRYDFFEPRIIRLPRCENNFESAERRLGGRIGIMTDIEIAGRRWCLGNTHLDVVNTPRCRAKQIRSFLGAINEPIAGGGGGRPAIIGGDLNTHTFARGTRLRAMKNTATILASRPGSLRRRLSGPETREPALRELKKFGFDTSAFNDRKATSRSIVSNLDDPTRLPRPMRWWVNSRIGPEGLLLEFRLDWLAGRGVRALSAGEVIDNRTGAKSVNPQTFHGLTHNGLALSDHDPIVVDLAL